MLMLFCVTTFRHPFITELIVACVFTTYPTLMHFTNGCTCKPISFQSKEKL